MNKAQRAAYVRNNSMSIVLTARINHVTTDLDRIIHKMQKEDDEIIVARKKVAYYSEKSRELRKVGKRLDPVSMTDLKNAQDICNIRRHRQVFTENHAMKSHGIKNTRNKRNSRKGISDKHAAFAGV